MTSLDVYSPTSVDQWSEVAQRDLGPASGDRDPRDRNTLAVRAHNPEHGW